MTSPWRTLIPALALCCALPAVAAREFTPQAGLWMIPSENNGQPGRGFSLDVQGNTAFLQVFNYEKSGAATFHTAVGQLDDAAAMTVPLLRFKGGRSFGGPVQDAVADGTAGDVTVKFVDGLNGTVQFPGESEQPISRFLIDQKLPLWWTQSATTPPEKLKASMEIDFAASGTDGTRYSWKGTLHGDETGALMLEMTPHRYLSTPDWDPSTRMMQCKIETATQVFDCLPAKPWEGERPLPDVLEFKHVRFRVLARDVVGEIQTTTHPEQRIGLNGWTQGTYSCAQLCMSPNVGSARIYSWRQAVSSSDCTIGCTGYYNVTLLPTSGAWIVDEEYTGRPGRGVFLDVQDNTVVVQTSDYLANGEPTFHLGSKPLSPSATERTSTTAKVPLQRYAGGRYFGGPAKSGVVVGLPGSIALDFAPYYGNNQYTDFATGQITLPNESAKRMRRLALEPISTGLDYFFGEYLVRWSLLKPADSSWVRLTRVAGEFVLNDDGSIQCTRKWANQPLKLQCALLDMENPQGPWKGIADIEIRPFDRGSTSERLIARTRDQHGHWLGLGAVNLPGLAIAKDQ